MNLHSMKQGKGREFGLMRQFIRDNLDDPVKRICTVGNVDAGKSTLLGVLTHNILDDGRGSREISFSDTDTRKKPGAHLLSANRFSDLMISAMSSTQQSTDNSIGDNCARTAQRSSISTISRATKSTSKQLYPA